MTISRRSRSARPCFSGLAPLPVLTLVATAGAQGPVVRDWSSDPGAPLGSTARVVVDSTGHTVTCSGTQANLSPTSAYHLFQTYRLDPAGNVLWSREHRPAGGWNERSYWLTVDSADHVVVVGTVRATQSGNPSRAVLKYDPAGNLLWAHTTPATSFATGLRVEVDAQDNVYVFGAGTTLAEVAKFDPQGNLLWTAGATPASGVPVRLDALAVAPDGRVAFTSTIQSTTAYTRCYDTNGQHLWTQQTPALTTATRDLAFDPNGAVYVSGADAGGPVVVRYSPAGALEWARHPAGLTSTAGVFTRLAVDAQGAVIATGQVIVGGLYLDWATFKVAPNGQEQWYRTYSGIAVNDERARALDVDPAGAVYVVGAARPAPTTCSVLGASDVDTTIVKYDAAGNEVWVAHAPCTGDPTSIAVAGYGIVVINTPDLVERWYEDSAPVSYCSANANSSGQVALLQWSGSTSFVANDLVLSLPGTLPQNAFGYFIASRSEGFVANPGGSAGNLCLGGAIGRVVGGTLFHTGAAGAASLAVDHSRLPHPSLGTVAAIPGETWHFQVWHRDLVGGSVTSNFSDGLEVRWH